MRSQGAQFAALDILRIALQHFKDEDLNFGLKKEILGGKDILQIAYAGELKLSMLDALVRVFRIGLIDSFLHAELIINLAYVHKLDDRYQEPVRGISRQGQDGKLRAVEETGAGNLQEDLPGVLIQSNFLLRYFSKIYFDARFDTKIDRNKEEK